MTKETTRVLLIIFSLGSLIIFCSGCDAIYRLLQREGAEEKDLLGVIVPHERNPEVVKVQKLLKLYGHKVGEADGVLGANTREAIKAFQEDNGLKPSRFVDDATWNKLMELEVCGLLKEGDLNIAAVQRAIKKAGLDPGSIDGKLGRKTLAAIKQFQEAEGLNPDGKVGFRTLRALAKYLSEKDM